jgi:4,5-DOPA dioxygenase extradiol
MEHPKTIHDFGGFPKALFDVEYPAPGSKWLAEETKKTITTKKISFDETWGLDHGAWSVIKHLYPKADVPIIQLSLDYNLTPQQHFDLASQLKSLRNKGVLIIGSGNIVHNLGLVAWDKLQEKEYGYDWALEVNTKIKSFIEAEDFKSLANYKNLGKAFQLAIPTPEHYLPLLYTLALKDKKETISFFNDKAIGGSLTMTSLKIT